MNEKWLARMAKWGSMTNTLYQLANQQQDIAKNLHLQHMAQLAAKINDEYIGIFFDQSYSGKQYVRRALLEFRAARNEPLILVLGA